MNRIVFTLVAISLPTSLVFSDEPGADGKLLFEQTIKPALIEHCYECHSKLGDEIGGGLELDSPSGMRRGGDSGPIFEAHDDSSSILLRMLRHDSEVSAMPPEHKLSDDVIATFEEWIRLGAPDTREDTGLTAKDERIAEGKRHWSFQPPLHTDPSTVQQSDWPRGAIDQFVLAQMEAKGLKPVADANRVTLVRRVYFDLIGLPPSPQQVKQFVTDESPDALADLIDGLLDSPRFGERWGRHWLDVVRYAESSGMEFNFTYPHAWPYRDYVIDAFNRDKPYDVFLREQIAGDLMPTADDDTHKAIEARRIATSILAFGPKRHNSSGTEFRMDIVDDQINTVFRATLALTVACSRCHDHKFDPIPTKDYYSLAGIFLSTDPQYGTIKQKYSNSPTDLLPLAFDGAAKHATAEAHEKKVQEAEKQLVAKRDELTKATEAEKIATTKKNDAEKIAQGATSDAAAQGSLDQAIASLQQAADRAATLKNETSLLDTQVKKLKETRPSRPHYAMTVRDRAKPADTKVAVRGNFRDLGEVAPRGFLSAVQVPKPPKIDGSSSGRLQLAEWITSPDNPLTARVMVNRIWHHLFGRGLVASVDNFGMIGKEPTHPELLDMLALQFVQEGWSVKRTIRTIMLSRAYQLSSGAIANNMEIDPENYFFWRATPRRLEAETIRDAILAVSGQLNLERPIGSTVTPLGDQLVRGIPTEKIQPPSDHRSVYLPVVRDYVPELFDLFDFPSPSLVSGKRSVTNVPSQALYLRNSKFVAEQTKHAAQRLLSLKEIADDAERADLATQWTLGRSITENEQAGALQLVHQIQQTKTEGSDASVDAWAAWFHTLFTTAEFRYLVDVN